MQKFLMRILISAMLISALIVLPVLADEQDEGEFSALSQKFLEWREKQNLPETKSTLPFESYPTGYVPSPIDLSYLADNPPVEPVSPYPNRKADTLPNKFDLRYVNGKSYVTSVKEQLPYGTCWAHAALGAMESNMLMQGLGNFDLSEMHLAWFTFRGDDKSKTFKNMHSSSFTSVMDNGGNSFYPAALFTRLSGPAYESDVPYGENKKPSSGSPDDYTRAVRLRDVYYLNFSNEPNVNASSTARDIVKRRIMETGAVVGNYYSNSSQYYKSSSAGTNYYYNSGSSTNHAVQIIGWDDNYSRNNFKNKPSIDGAWLIKNSWGDEWWGGYEYVGNDGCFWISYAQYLTEGSAFICEKSDQSMKAYYYDPLGWCATFGYSGSTIHFANVFEAERNTETLKEVGFITPDNNIDYTIKVYRGLSAMPQNSPIPSRSTTPDSTTSGTISYAGYHTVTLDTPVTLSKGEYFSVIVTFTNYAKTAVEMKVSGWSNNAVIEEGSFFSSNGTSWTKGESQSMNATVKAYTVTGTVSGTAPRIHDGYPPDAYINNSYSATISASGTRPITWSASTKIPAGLSINASTGEISGTPTKEGNFTFSVTATNSYGSDTKYYTMNVWGVPQADTLNLTAYVGHYMYHQMTLTPYTIATWSTSDTLPPGISLSKSGLISGKPLKTGNYTATLKALTLYGLTSEAAVTFTINAKPVKPTIKIASLKTITVGDEFLHEIETTGTEPITVKIEGQPDGISLKGGSVYMSGRPTTAGTYSIKITAENIATELDNKPVTKTVKLTVKAHPPVISAPEALNDGIIGERYDYVQFSLSEGDLPVTWKLSGQPSGITISPSGLLFGRPTKAGKFNITVTASNAGGKDSVRLPMTVLQKPVIATPKMNAGITDKKYSARFTAKGNSPITWEVEGLPDTLTLTQNATGTTATIAGTPVEIGNYNVTLRASNAAGTSEATVKFHVLGVAPRMYATLAKGKVDNEYSEYRIYATGTKPITITCDVDERTLQQFGISGLDDIGLTFTADAEQGTASLYGTPGISVKNLPITFTATNAVYKGLSTKRVNLTIAGEKPVFTAPEENTVNITCPVNSNITQSFTVDGSKNITYSMNKVSGFSLTQTDDYSAVVSGTAPARDSTVTINVTAENSNGKATKRIVIKAQTPPKIITESLPSTFLNSNYTCKLIATGTKNITWSLEGDLPEGLKFSNGSLSGKPQEAGDFAFTLTASNAVSEDMKEYILSVKDPDTSLGSLPEIPENTEQSPEAKTETVKEPEQSEKNEVLTAEPVITFGESRTFTAQRTEIEGSGYIIAAVFPEVSVNVSGMYDLEAELYENVPVGAKLYWLAYPEGEGSEDDAIAEFYDDAGAEIETVPAGRKIVVSVWLNEGVKYSPVIAVK